MTMERRHKVRWLVVKRRAILVAFLLLIIYLMHNAGVF